MVGGWFGDGPNMMLGWCLDGFGMVFGWCLDGFGMVLGWFEHGVWMVRIGACHAKVDRGIGENPPPLTKVLRRMPPFPLTRNDVVWVHARGSSKGSTCGPMGRPLAHCTKAEKYGRLDFPRPLN